jgi:cytochrome c-type biogenesis protein
VKRCIPITVAAVVAAACNVAEFRPVEVGDPAPPFTAFTLEGAETGSADLLGGPYMLNVWATWCAPCREEMPELQELHDTYADRGFQVVAVSVDGRNDGDQILAFLEEHDITFPVWHDPTWAIQDAYFLLGLPGSFLIDAEGKIVRKWLRPIRAMEEDVQGEVRALLPAAAAQP